jgi:hypothetical protein
MMPGPTHRTRIPHKIPDTSRIVLSAAIRRLGRASDDAVIKPLDVSAR